MIWPHNRKFLGGHAPVHPPDGGEARAARDFCLSHYAKIGLCFAALREQYNENAHLLSDRTINKPLMQHQSYPCKGQIEMFFSFVCSLMIKKFTSMWTDE